MKKQTSKKAEKNWAVIVEPALVSVPSAAHSLGISVRFVRALISRGQVPVCRLGRRVLVRRSDLLAIVERGGLPSTVRA